MSKYLEFKEIPFKGKTKRFDIVSKTTNCQNCEGYGKINRDYSPDTCPECFGYGNIILGRIQWYSQWRQYTFSPAFPTIWNRDCMITRRFQSKKPNKSNIPKSKIWALFSIANDYDQPENDLVAWWSGKPSFEILSGVFGIIIDKEKGHSGIGKVLKGQEVRIGGADYRLEEISEGKLQ